MMNLLALDMATKTGWATDHASGVWDLSIRKDESSGMRLVRFEAKLKEMISACEIDLIVFESITAGGGRKANFDAIKLGTKLQAIVERMVEKTEGLESRGYNINEIKRYAIPEKGKRNKEAMLAAARKRWPDENVIDDNQADALFLLDLARSELDV